jgi:hypothetical protein
MSAVIERETAVSVPLPLSVAGSGNVVPSWAHDLSVTLEYITPEVAEKYLLRNTGNYRKIRKKPVAMMVNDLIKGHFDFLGDTIGFDTDGVLTDGQHRLSAVVKSEVGIWVLVVRGLSPDVRKSAAKDTGGRRSTFEHLTSLGYVSANLVSAVIRLAYRVREGDIYGGTDRATDSVVVEIAKKFPGLVESAYFAQKVRDGGVSHTALGVWHWLAGFEGQTEILDECMGVLAGKLDVSTFHPFARVRETLLKQRQETAAKRGTVSTEHHLRLLFAAWEKAKAGEQAKNLRGANKLRLCDAAVAATEAIRRV